MIDSIYVNDVSILSYNPAPVLSGDFKIQPSICEVGVQKEGIIFFPAVTADPNGNIIQDGTIIRIRLHMTNGKDYCTKGYKLLMNAVFVSTITFTDP